MLFNTLSFIIFIICVTLAYYLLPCFIKHPGTQTVILIISGLFFYAYNHPAHALCLIVVILINEAFFFSSRSCFRKGHTSRACFLTISGISVNVLILFFFKYCGLAASTLFGNGSISELFLSIPLPLGISFYIFHAISLLANSQKNDFDIAGTPVSFTDILCYMTFFPNSVSGPITSFKDFRPQICRHYFKDADLRKTFEYLLTGYFFKVSIADNIQNYTTYLTETDFSGGSPVRILSQMFGYSCQIFSDFAGYSYIAIGLGVLLGIKLPQNFNFPYISQSLTEFWRRWHMSLSAWLKEYIYIPLGGNRKGRVRTYLNLMTVMLIGGIWHGSESKYLLWGALHGLLLVFEKLMMHLFPSKKKFPAPIRFLKIIMTFTIVSWLWLFFKMKNLNAVMAITYQMFTGWNSILSFDSREILMLCFYMLPVFLLHLFYILKEHLTRTRNINLRFPLYAVMILFLLLNRGTSDAFIYFQY